MADQLLAKSLVGFNLPRQDGQLRPDSCCLSPPHGLVSLLGTFYGGTGEAVLAFRTCKEMSPSPRGREQACLPAHCETGGEQP